MMFMDKGLQETGIYSCAFFPYFFSGRMSICDVLVFFAKPLERIVVSWIWPCLSKKGIMKKGEFGIASHWQGHMPPVGLEVVMG